MIVLERDPLVLKLADSVNVEHLAENAARVVVGENLASLHEVIFYLRLEEVDEAHCLREIFGARCACKSSELIP